MLKRAAKKGTSSDNWKSKYNNIIEELSAKEREWAKAEELLRRTIRRLTIAANGVHPALDKRLADLRKTMDKDLDLKLLQEVSDSMPDTLRELCKETQHQLTPAKVLIMLADQLENIDSIRQQAKTLRSRLQNEPDQDELQNIVNQFASLLGTPSTSAHQGSVARIESTTLADQINLINIFISHLDFPEISNTDLMSIQARSAEAAPEIHRELAIELTTLLNKAGAELGEQIPLEANGIYNAADAVLLLIEFLSFPESLSEDINNIRARLEKPLSEEEWPRLLKLLANVIERARNQVQQQKYELENFLGELTHQIERLDSNISGISEMRRNSKKYSDELDKNVKERVQGIQESIESDEDLTLLRKSVFSHLDGLREHMHTFQGAQQKIHANAEKLVKELSEKVEAMERETTTLHEQMKYQRNQAIIDPLTQSHNRLAFDERMALEYSRWKRKHEPLSIIILDADHFKLVNDSFGHLTGDDVLRLIAKTIGERARESDFVARYGGEEFVMLLPGADSDAALTIAEEIRKAIEFSQYKFHGKLVPITVSAGIASFTDGDNPESLFTRADNALYEAKRKGRNRCHVAICAIPS